MQNILLYIQIGSAILLILTILSQSKSAGLSATFGGGGGAFTSKRGVDRILENATIVFAIVFFGAALAYIFI
ncbi:MAG: preprotein translocase subunit SecG [Patescibacteria group bacterium]|jgi:protein translocase SecG subunit